MDIHKIYYTHIYIYIYIYIYNICVLRTTAICRFSSSLHSQQWLSTAKSRVWSATNLFLTNFRDLILWRCSYGPWHHFMFFGEQLDPTCVLAVRVRVQLFERTQITSRLARCNVPSCTMCQKAFIF